MNRHARLNSYFAYFLLTCVSLTVFLLLFCCSTTSAQVSSSAPKSWKSARSVGLGSFGFDLEHNLRDTVYRELLDTNTVLLIAKSVGLTEHEKTLFQIAPGSIDEEVRLYVLGNEWTEGCGRFASRLGAYVGARMDGHSRECLVAGITNHQSYSANLDPELLILATNNFMLPVSRFKRAESGMTTNKAGQVASRSMTLRIVDGKQQLFTNYTHLPQIDEVCRWTSYTLVDGEIGWRYCLRFKADGSLESIDTSKFDAKEIDPKFQPVIKSVESEVEAQMKQNGTSGRFGAVHTYWQLKKEKLKAKGIDWRSPSELNTGAIYD